MVITISFFSELRYKEVIDIHSGFRLGYVCDAEYDDAEGRILSLVTPGRSKFFGLFGREEIEEITPAIEAAKELGIRAEGPVPPDTIFSKARGGWYDMVVAMYHDQGHIPLKVVGFVYNHEKKMWDAVAGVNITLGLPIVRVSVDHGTAFDQAGKGVANELSLLNSIDYAVRLSQSRMAKKEQK